MSQFDPLERDLAAWFSATAVPQTPPNFEATLRLTARTRQRPRWTFLERLLPETATASIRGVTLGVPWRAAGLLALLLLAFVVGVILTAGTQRRMPAPFGPAGTGLVTYSAEGDIFTVDRAGGEPRPIVAGPWDDVNPQWSRDGTRIVFERLVDRGLLSLLFVVNDDGTGLTQITPEPLSVADDPTSADYMFSPDGTEVLFVSGSRLHIAYADGSGLRRLGFLSDVAATEAAYRPSNGSQIAFFGPDFVIYLADLERQTVRPLVPRAPHDARQYLIWSPDGSALGYQGWFDAPTFTVRAHLYDVERGEDRLADPDADVYWDALPVWSNDGQRLALYRGYEDAYNDVTVAIIAADGSRTLAETPHGEAFMWECCSVLEWAPDDSAILLSRADQLATLHAQVVIDPQTGSVSDVSWPAASDPSWQRLPH